MRHSIAWRQASLSTNRPMSMMRPLSSAIGMNSSGPTSPRVGWFQRRSASNDSMARRLEVDERLVVENELAVLQRVTQVAVQLVMGGELGLHLGFEDLEAIATATLRGVHRDVGPAEQLVGVERIGAVVGDSDRRANEDLAAVHHERVPERVEHALQPWPRRRRASSRRAPPRTRRRRAGRPCRRRARCARSGLRPR